MHVRPARDSDRDQLAEMRVSLWPDGSFGEHLRELEQALSSGMSGTLPVAIFVAQDADDSLAGFLEVGMRSHADGCDPSRPVGFVEGWFVREPFRNRGVGRELKRAAEQLARARGCREMASDTWIDHEGSQRAHEALGFEIVDRCVHFRKAL